MWRAGDGRVASDPVRRAASTTTTRRRRSLRAAARSHPGDAALSEIVPTDRQHRAHGPSRRPGARAMPDTVRRRTRWAMRGWYYRGNYEGDTHDVSLLLLRQEPGSSATPDRRTWRCLHL